MAARTSLFFLLFLASLAACAPELTSGSYACIPDEPGGCPSSWLCQCRGAGCDYRCYESSGGYCGDGEVSPGEQCDGIAFADDARCTSGFRYCRVDCQLACTQCGDGVLEATPSGEREQCDDGNLVDGDGCSATCKLARCGDGIVDASLFETCDLGAANSDLPDAACRSNCQLARCGDRVVDTGEVCDDGNLDPRDRCTPDCQSDVRCGNGYVDFLVGEMCDDANALSHDGCSSNCLAETPAWTKELPAGSGVSPRERHALAYDASRGRLVLFGGRDTLRDPSVYLGDVVEWDGTRWRGNGGASGPSARSGHAMAYDNVRKRILLFGGSGVGGSDGATWEWDGARWTRVANTDASPTFDGPMATDPIRKRVVLFSGQGDAVWEWNGELRSWSRIPIAAGGPSADAGMVFDPVLGRVVLVGGGGATNMWQWNGAAWSVLTPTTRTVPPSGAIATMTYDVKRQRLVMVRSLSEIWEWSSAAKSWEMRTPTGLLPETRDGYTVGYDGARGRTLMIAGRGHHDIWAWNGTRWSEVTELTNMAPTSAGYLVYDASNGRSLQLSSESANGTWSWRDGVWAPMAPAGAAPVSGIVGVTYDQRRQRAVVVDGNSRAAWEWDGLQWGSIAALPVSAAAARAVYDPVNRRTLVFSGISMNNDVLAWNGATWSFPTLFENRRLTPAITYDWLRGRMVLFGGFDGGRVRSDTFEMSSTGWTQRSPSGSPPASDNGRMGFDPNRRRSVYLDGGKTWEWDGEEWTDVTPTGAAPSNGFSLCYNPMRSAMQTPDDNGALWAFAYKHPVARDESCQSGFDVDGDQLIGCADPDCWAYCTPHCSPGQTGCDPTAPKCGDNVCNSALENCRICPSDCGGCPAACGDFLCDAPETATSCPGDCQP